MRILQFTFSLTSGGGEKFAVDLANELVKTNEVFFCVVLSEQFKIHNFFKDQLDNRVQYINLNGLKGINVKTFFSVFKLIKQIKPDIIHFHLNTILYMYLPSLIFRNKINFVQTLHSITSKTIGFKWQRKINRLFYKKKFIKPVVISEENKKSFLQFYGINHSFLIENGVAPSHKTNKFDIVKDELNKLKIKESDKIFIHIGGYLEAKNQELLIRTFNKLIIEGYGVILLVIGKYFDMPKAEPLIKSSKKGIYFIGTKKNISDYLLNSDAFVLSSLWEGLPISLLEAMSCGTIPVCTPAGGIPDVIKNETIGYLSKDFTEQGLYEVTIKCLNKMDRFDRENLKDCFNSNFSINKCAKKYQIIYNQ